MSQTPPPISFRPNPPAATPGMTPAQIAIITALGLTFLLVIVGVGVFKFLSWRHAGPIPLAPTPSGRANEVLFAAPRFSLKDQDDKPFSTTDLHGKAYICDFIFTTCGSACPIMSHKLAGLQKDVPAAVHLVSFTVNPEHDTSAVLKAYAGSYRADSARWHFLTGTPQQMLDTVNGMKLAFKAADDRNPILHSEKFLLVDGDGNIRASYDSNDEKAMKDLVADAAWLASTSGAKGK